MTTFARALLLVSFVVTAAWAQGCQRSCTEHLRTYMLDDAELARVTQGTGNATAAGCDIVCNDRRYYRDAAGSDDAGARNFDDPVAGCTLSGRELTCDFGIVCAV
jgi:hypothetical protein